MPPIAPSTSKYFDKTEYERQVSQRRREKITSLKSQLIGMLQNQAVSKSEMLHHSNSMQQQTPVKRVHETSVKHLQSHERQISTGIADSNEKANPQRHSALKSRQVTKPTNHRLDRNAHQFQLVTTQPVTPARASENAPGFNDNFVVQTGGTIRSICHNTESKFSMYSYSESEIMQTPSPIEKVPMKASQQDLQQHHFQYQQRESRIGQHKMENLMDNEQSITFISSKFIKSNSVESIPDLQGAPRHLRQLSNREDTSEFALSTNVGGGNGAGIFSDTNPSQGPINVHTYKKRNQGRHASLVEPSFQTSDYMLSNQTLSRSRERSPRKAAQIVDIVKKEELQKLQNAIKQLQSDEQIKQIPVLYINELRRLAKVINRVFGDGLLY
ncbi:hypothetical protein FGO68_gene9428 [Halteria grandinella]|uniref:Uncharacterized protein n=1 Tax=Halteria grandinella TaxID=5974 RepID=A0A8J8TA61_HALGN|nr:hypothetical protein FGO68_gene9428 [Halteria grandinella]